MHVNVHRHATTNRCTRCRATTKRWRLSTAEVDKGGAPCGRDAILRTEEHGRERLAQRWFGCEARSRPARRKTGETQQCGGGAQRRRGITRASAWTCVCVSAWARSFGQDGVRMNKGVHQLGMVLARPGRKVALGGGDRVRRDEVGRRRRVLGCLRRCARPLARVRADTG
jgi:hypothetical protein